MNIVITNTVSLNTGDAAILAGVVTTIREAFGEVAITVLDKNAEAAAKYYPDLEFNQKYIQRRSYLERLLDHLSGRRRLGTRSRRWIELMRPPRLMPRLERANLALIEQCDLVVSTGGTYLVDHYDFTDSLIQFRLAQRAQKPLVLFTQSVGPFSNPAPVARALEGASLILLRDAESMRHLAEAGVDLNRARVVADAAFALAHPKPIRVSLPPRHVAISVRDWSFPGSRNAKAARDQYFGAVRALVSELVRNRGCKVTFLSTCQGIPEYWTDDSRSAQEILNDLEPSVRQNVGVNSDYHSPKELLFLLESFDLVIATRMHMAILSLCAGVPVLPIAYEFKTKELFRTLGLSRFVTDVQDARGPQLIAEVDELTSTVDEWRGPLEKALADQRKSILELPEILRATIWAPGD